MEESVIDLRDIIATVMKRWKFVAIITVIFVFISAILSFFVMKPVYESQTTLIVKTEKVAETQIISSDQVNVSQKLAITYGEIIKSRVVLEEVIKNLKLKESYSDLLGKISVSTVENTQIIEIVVEDTNNLRAMSIANEIPKVFTKQVIRIADANGVEIIDKAKVSKNPIKPNKRSNIMVAGILGVVIGVSIILIREFFDNKIKTADDATKELGLPVLGVVPKE